MKNLPLEYYEQFPFARKAVIFLRSAKKSNEITNTDVGSWEVSYYLLSHAVELSMKAVARKETGEEPLRLHDKQKLAYKYLDICKFKNHELGVIKRLKNLNNGPGGLRYDNKIKGEFYPFDFRDGVKIVERLLEYFEK